MRRGSRDSGSVMLLVLGLVVLLVLLVTVVVDVTALFLARKDLLAAADGAALAGAQQLDAEQIYREGIGSGSLPLDPVAAERAARSYIADAGLGDQLVDLSVDVRATGTSVTVRLHGKVALPFISDLTRGAAGGVDVAAAATASTQLVDG